MKRKLTTILLLICLVLLLLGGSSLYRKLSNDRAPVAADEEASDSDSGMELEETPELLPNASDGTHEDESESITDTKDTAADFVMLDRD